MGRLLRGLLPQLPITLLLLLAWGFFVLMAPETFLARSIYISFMTSIPFVAIVAMGMTLVIVAGEMDLSFASNMAMSGFVFAVVTRGTGSPALGMAAGLLTGSLIGTLNGLVIVGTGVPSIVATIGFDFLWRFQIAKQCLGIAVLAGAIGAEPLGEDSPDALVDFYVVKGQQSLARFLNNLDSCLAVGSLGNGDVPGNATSQHGVEHCHDREQVGGVVVHSSKGGVRLVALIKV